jgi:hypothetical protein
MNFKRLMKVKDAQGNSYMLEDAKYLYSDNVKIQIAPDFCAMYLSYNGKAWSNNPDDANILITLEFSGGDFDKMFNRFIASLETYDAADLYDIAAALKLGYDVAKDF